MPKHQSPVVSTSYSPNNLLLCLHGFRNELPEGSGPFYFLPILRESLLSPNMKTSKMRLNQFIAANIQRASPISEGWLPFDHYAPRHSTDWCPNHRRGNSFVARCRRTEWCWVCRKDHEWERGGSLCDRYRVNLAIRSLLGIAADSSPPQNTQVLAVYGRVQNKLASFEWRDDTQRKRQYAIRW
jgi:hypothetical protein